MSLQTIDLEKKAFGGLGGLAKNLGKALTSKSTDGLKFSKNLSKSKPTGGGMWSKPKANTSNIAPVSKAQAKFVKNSSTGTKMSNVKKVWDDYGKTNPKMAAGLKYGGAGAAAISADRILSRDSKD